MNQTVNLNANHYLIVMILQQNYLNPEHSSCLTPNKPFNEYIDVTLFPAGFPVLYPYGVGGHEDSNRLSHISLKDYTNHLMRHCYPKFRHHRSFPFVTFNILQWREASSA